MRPHHSLQTLPLRLSFGAQADHTGVNNNQVDFPLLDGHSGILGLLSDNFTHHEHVEATLLHHVFLVLFGRLRSGASVVRLYPLTLSLLIALSLHVLKLSAIGR